MIRKKKIPVEGRAKIKPDNVSDREKVGKFSEELRKMTDTLAKKHGFAEPTLASSIVVLAKKGDRDSGEGAFSDAVGGFLLLDPGNELFSPAHVDGVIGMMENNLNELKRNREDARARGKEQRGGADIGKLMREIFGK